MPDTTKPGYAAKDVLLAQAEGGGARPIHLVRPAGLEAFVATLPPAAAQWLKATGFKGHARRHVLIPAADGSIAGVALGLGEVPERNGAEPSSTFLGLLPTLLPAGDYQLATAPADPLLAAVAWGLGAYRFRRYKSGDADPLPRLRLAPALLSEATRIVDAVAGGRDLINTPPNDLGPHELEMAARALAARHDATVASIVGEALLRQNFPLIHAVGRASPREPRLIDITAGRDGAPKVTIVGKGICFDTGGLDLKPSSAMLLMKKDMGGAAAALALADMVLGAGLDVRLRVLIPAAENSVAGNAFRPGDVIKSRAGKSVEIGNTDAEGRLVLADALSLADEESPDLMITFATLTGAARVAVGPEIAPYFTDDDKLAADIDQAARTAADPVWRMPLTTPYDSWLDSPVADMNNVADGGFAGSIVGAIFLKKFVSKARSFAHFDIYGWRPAPKAFGPKGGETNAARAVFQMLAKRFPRPS